MYDLDMLLSTKYFLFIPLLVSIGNPLRIESVASAAKRNNTIFLLFFFLIIPILVFLAKICSNCAHAFLTDLSS